MSEKKPEISKDEPTYDKAAWDELFNNPQPLLSPENSKWLRDAARNPKPRPELESNNA